MMMYDHERTSDVVEDRVESTFLDRGGDVVYVIRACWELDCLLVLTQICMFCRVQQLLLPSKTMRRHS